MRKKYSWADGEEQKVSEEGRREKTCRGEGEKSFKRAKISCYDLIYSSSSSSKNQVTNFSQSRLSDCIIGAEIVGGAVIFPSGAPNDVCRRSREPNTRLFFESSDALDANEPVLWRILSVLVLFLSFFLCLCFIILSIFRLHNKKMYQSKLMCYKRRHK